MHRVARLGEEPPDCRLSRVGTVLGKPQEREPGLRLIAVRDRLLVCHRSRTELTADPQHIATLAHRQACRGGRPGLDVALDGAIELIEGLVIGAAHAHDLATVHGTLRGERNQSRLDLAPRRQGMGPFGGASEVRDLLTALNHRAVDRCRRTPEKPRLQPGPPSPRPSEQGLAGPDRHTAAADPVPTTPSQSDRDRRIGGRTLRSRQHAQAPRASRPERCSRTSRCISR